MGFTEPEELERTRENCIDWEEQEVKEIKQNSWGIHKRKYSKTKQRFYYKPQDNDKSHINKFSERDKNENLNEEILNTLIWKPEEQQEFEDKLKSTKENLESLEEKINNDIENLQKPFKNDLKEEPYNMERKKKSREKYNKDTTWAESLKENRNLNKVKEISKEHYSFKHQGVSTSPRYYSDKNLALRPKMRSVASQIGAEEELLDQGAVGDHNSLKHVKSLKDFQEKGVCHDLRNQTIVNCCYGLTHQNQGLENCQGTAAANKQQCHYCNCPQRGATNQHEYTYCCEEYYYNLGNCNCLKSCPNCGQERDYRRQITDLNTDYFYQPPKDKSGAQESDNKKSKRKSSDKYKSKESSDEFNENKKRECEERLKKLKEKSNKNCHSKKEDCQKLKQLLKEENAKKLIKYLDQYVEDHERELRDDLKNLQTKEETTSSTTLNSTILGKTKEKYFHIKIKEHQKQREIKVTKSLEGQYSKATLKMLKKMTIREYKPRKSLEGKEDKKLLDKIKNYHDYEEKFEKEMSLNKSLETLKSPPEFFAPQDSGTNERFENGRETLTETPKEQNEVDKEKLEKLRDPRTTANKRDHQERRTMSQDTLQSQTVTPSSNREQILSPTEQIKILREQLQRAQQRDNKIRPKDSQDSSECPVTSKDQRESRQREQLREQQRVDKQSQTSLQIRQNIPHPEDSLNDTESFEAFRYEYGPESRTKKTWDDYKESESLETQKYEAPFKEESNKEYREIKRKPKEISEKETADYEDDPYKYKERTRKSALEKSPDSEKEAPRQTREMSEQERINLLKRIVDSYERTENKIRKDFSAKYEDKRREILERNEYESGQLSKREYREMNVEQKYIREQFGDFEDKEEKAKDFRSRKDQEKIRDSRDQRLSAEERIMQRDLEEQRPSIRDRLKGENIEDVKLLESKYDQDKINDYKERRSSVKRDSVKEGRPARDRLSQREYPRESRVSDAAEFDTSYNKNYRKDSRSYEDKQPPKYYKDPGGFVEQRDTKTREPIPSYYRDKREDQDAYYYEDKRKESLEPSTYYEDERRDFLEAKPSTDEQHRFSYNRDKRRVKEPMRKEQISKYYRDRNEEFREDIPPPTEDPRSKYYDYEKEDLGRDSFESKNALKERLIRHEKYDLNKEPNSEYYDFKTKDSRDKIPREIERQRPKSYKQDLGDPLRDKPQPSSKPRHSQSIRKSDEYPRSSRYEDYEPETKDLQREIQNRKVQQLLKEEMKKESDSYMEEFAAQAEEPKRERISSPRKPAYKEDIYERHEGPSDAFIKESLDAKETPDIPPSQSELQDREDSHYSLKQDDDGIAAKSHTSSYQDFKEVMDHNLGFQTHRESQTDYNFDRDIKQPNSTQTFNKETSLPLMPASTEEALDFLKNLIESTPKLGLRNECLSSVTLAAKDLITKLSSCQSSQPTESLTTSNERKSSNDTNNYILEEKSTAETQYKDLETTTDSSENQLREPVIIEEPNDLQQDDFIPQDSNTLESPSNPPYCDVQESGELNFLQQESYQYQSQINPPYYSSTEIYESCLKSKDNLDSSKSPQEFIEQAECLNRNVPICDESTTLTYQRECLEPCLSLRDCKYRPLPSPRRQTAFDPDLQPLKGILKPCREMEECQSCNQITRRTTSVVNFGQRDEINIETESTMVCQQEQEEMAQHFNESRNIFITRDQTLQPREKQINYKVNKITSVTPTQFQDCLPNSESNCSACNGTNLCRDGGIPEFKQCPCMLPTYNKMLINYYKGKK